GVDFRAYSSRHNSQDAAAELDQQTVHGVLSLLFQVVRLRFSEGNGGVDELGVSGELGSGEAGYVSGALEHVGRSARRVHGKK
ncbi:UNVERIFIED_CONTAM: hypothetical protein NY603_32905, partial [Bacteroidetes bacterium 56_B9]